MHRNKLCNAIGEYANRYPDEAAVVERFQWLLANHQNCFDRDCWFGHITGSAWLVDPGGTRVLLTHHRKLDIWVQLGGHSDGETDTAKVAVQEAVEESGLTVELLRPEIFDLDVHEIPARKSDPAHDHFDVRFQLRAGHTDFVVSDESHALEWVPVAEIERVTMESSILRMRHKWLARDSC